MIQPAGAIHGIIIFGIIITDTATRIAATWIPIIPTRHRAMIDTDIASIRMVIT